MSLYRLLARPVLRPRRAMGAVVRGRGRDPRGGGRVDRARDGAHRLPAERGVPHHLHPRARGVDVNVRVPRDGGLERDRASFNTRLSAMMAQALAPTGAWMTFIALWTGAFWGRPTWGTYWAWDARMTSELVLLFLYFGIIALRNAIEDPRRADRACGVLAIVGAINIPIIYYSVTWWNTLHQGLVDHAYLSAEDRSRHAGGDARHVARGVVLLHRGRPLARARSSLSASADRRGSKMGSDPGWGRAEKGSDPIFSRARWTFSR